MHRVRPAADELRQRLAGAGRRHFLDTVVLVELLNYSCLR